MFEPKVLGANGGWRGGWVEKFVLEHSCDWRGGGEGAIFENKDGGGGGGIEKLLERGSDWGGGGGRFENKEGGGGGGIE